jgi:cytoskeleton protein RodZ
MPEIGQSLREARMRARIDVSEIEAKTKIRAKYLRALENEEWGLLPGPTFVKSFLRTYAQALGLDAKALLEEYRLHHEAPGEPPLEPISSSPRRARGHPSAAGRPSSGPSRAYMALVGFVLLIIVLLIAALIAGGSSSKSKKNSAAARVKHRHTHAGRGAAPATSTGTPALVSLSLRPSATVYVCLIGDGGRKLIGGLELQPGARTRTYHARRFEINLGNNAVTMVVDGKALEVPPSNQAIGYTITEAGGRRPLPVGQLPTCM